MRDIRDVREFVAQCDVIYHLAGKNRESDGGILANNLVGTGNLVLACLQTAHQPFVVFASSTQVTYLPESEYKLAKATEEDMVRRLKEWCIFRIPNVYGPGARPEYNSVVATFAHRIANGEDVRVDDPEAKRPFIYVDDLVEKLLSPVSWRVITLPGELLTIGEIHELLTTRLGEHKNLETCLQYEKEKVDDTQKTIPDLQHDH